MVDKAHIVAEIQRTAGENGGAPLGSGRFAAETGIRITDWQGKYWARWSDALWEAGYTANTLQVAYSEGDLLGKLASLAKELGRFPGRTDIQLKAHDSNGFPHPTTFQRRGLKNQLAAKLAKYCEGRPGYEDVVRFCAQVPREASHNVDTAAVSPNVADGYVYLLKSGRFFKIGRTNAVGRRERELAIQMPEEAAVAHKIRTDDPVGIESYWHRRFEDKRKHGEWFALTAQDVAAFKRRKFM